MRLVVVGDYGSGVERLASLLSELGIHFGQTPLESQLENLELYQRLRRWWNEPHLVASISSSQRRAQLTQWVNQLEMHAPRVAAASPLLTLCLEDIRIAWGSDVRYIWCRRARSETPPSTGEDTGNHWPEFAQMQATLNEVLRRFFETQACLQVDIDEWLSDDTQLARMASFLQLEVSDFMRGQIQQRLEQWGADPLTNSNSSKQIESVSSGLVRADREQSLLPPKIIATVLAGNAESLIGPAIESVIDWVDEVCLIDTGIEDGTLELARQIAGSRLTHRRFAWCQDFAAARNAALQLATELDGTWALTLDTDERFTFAGFRDKEQLLSHLQAAPDIDLWLVAHSDRSYIKERFIRLPTRLHWDGRTHEGLVGSSPSSRRILSKCRFWEEPKSAEAFTAKLQRDLAILLHETKAHPLTARWWFYLGQTYEGLKQHQDAVRAFERCIRIDDWAEESSWACYLAARCLTEMKEFREAEEFCTLGMCRKPTSVELRWLAGWCCFQRAAYAESIAWAQMALQITDRQHALAESVFRYLPAWFEAPHDVLRHAYRRLNQLDLAKQAEVDFQSACRAHQDYLNSFA